MFTAHYIGGIVVYWDGPKKIQAMSVQTVERAHETRATSKRQGLWLVLSFAVALVGSFPYFLLLAFPLVASLAFTHARRSLRLTVGAMSAALLIVGIAMWVGGA